MSFKNREKPARVTIDKICGDKRDIWAVLGKYMIFHLLKMRWFSVISLGHKCLMCYLIAIRNGKSSLSHSLSLAIKYRGIKTRACIESDGILPPDICATVLESVNT